MLGEGARPIHEIDWKSMGPVAIVLGNEESGISSEMRDLADHLVVMPMKGFAQSFSLSVSCAVITSHLNSQGALEEVRHATLAHSSTWQHQHPN